MTMARCFCGAEFPGEDAGAQFRIARAHFDEQHAELRLRDAQIRNYLERAPQLSDETEAVAEVGSVEIHEVTPERVEDWLELFDHRAFAGNPAWAGCYCIFHHLRGDISDEQWQDRRWQDNRRDMSERLRARRATGYLAYVAGRAAGWVNASARAELADHRLGPGAEPPDERVVAIACFVIAPPYRGHGLARALLTHAVANARWRSMAAVEGYPRKQTRGDAGSAYHGPLPLYEELGFEPVGEDGDVITMRRSLG